MLFAGSFWSNGLWFFFQPVGEICLKPVASLGTYAQIATSFAVNPTGEIDPLHDLVGPFAIPGQIFAQVAIRLGAVVPKAAQHVDAYFFRLLIGWMCLEEF